MARKITIDDIHKINELYYKYHNYAEVARQTGLVPQQCALMLIIIIVLYQRKRFVALIRTQI